MCVYAHISIIVCIIHIYIGWLQGYYASSILNVEVSHCSQRIFYCESCRIRAQHVFLGFGIWELIKVWNWNLGGALQLGHNCIPAPLLHTHARMQPVIHRYVCVYVCKYIYIYIACLRKFGTLFGFLIWTLLYWGSGPYIIYCINQSIDLRIYPCI